VNLSRRLVIFSFFLFVALLAGVLFWPFILNEIIKPISIVVWLLLRILVLSIDQKYYWGAIIFVAAFFIYRFLPQQQSVIEPDDSQDSNSTLKTIGYWHNLFTFVDQHLLEEKNLKRELVRLLIAFYATKQNTTANFRLYEALQQGELPLPKHIHAYLFPEEPPNTKNSLKKRIQSVGNAPQKLIRRVTGQETVKHNRIIDEVLGFMETELEIKNDNGKFSPN
jgi:hypothetical protein